MEYKVKKNNNATAEITIRFSPEEWDKGFEKAYEKNRDKVKVPGFRPGKVPMERVRKILGNSVMEEAIEYTVSEGLKNIYPSLEPRPFRYPRFRLEEETLDRSKGFTVVGVYDTYPEVTLPKIRKIKIETYQVEPGDLDVQQELERIRKSLARNVLKDELEPVEEGNLLEVRYRFAEPEKEMGDTFHTSKILLGDPNNLPGFDTHLIGMKTGETKTFDYTFPDPFSAFPDSQGKTFRYEVTVTAAYTVNLPEIDDELAGEFDGSESLEELKKKISDWIREEKNRELKGKALREIYEILLEEAKFTIPESLIQEETQSVFQELLSNSNVQNNVTMQNYADFVNQPLEVVESQFRRAALSRLKQFFLRMKIAEEEKIEVTEEDFLTRMDKIAEKWGEDPNSTYKKIEKNSDLMDAIRNEILMSKVDQFVYETVEKKKPRTVSPQEAENLLKKENTTV